jgi:hypothetical protein
MSRSQPALTNPCQKFIEIKADTGRFFYYDKEQEKQVDIPLPIYFTCLDELNTITGFNKKHKCSIYSNEVKYLKKDILRVKTFKGGESITGLYDDIRDSIVALGGHFTKSVYALMINPDKSTEFVNFKFKGAAFSAWLDKKFDGMKFIVGITEFVEEQNGATTYQVPIFKQYKCTPEIDEEALHYDEILQTYLKEYFAKEPEKEIAQAEAANPLIEELPDKQGKWQTKEPKMERVPKGKQEVKSMTDPKELGNYPDDMLPDYPPDNDELKDLPF